jgi:hypothetical protein
MKGALLAYATCLCGSLLGCASSDPPGGAGAGTGGTVSGGGASSSLGGASSAGASAGSSGGSAGAGGAAGNSSSAGSSASGSSGAGSAGAAGSIGSAGAAGSTGSAACQMYCACHEQNCKSQLIPGGKSCAEFCAGMTADQLACRQNMCTLAPLQPDNNHCVHSVGINECL